jgi:uncharacterized membrane protein
LDGPSTRDSSTCCESRRRTFDSIPTLTIHLSHLEGLQDAVNSGLTLALVLNPIACGITFLALFCVILFAWKQSRLSAILGVCIGLLAAILATIAFIIDIVVMTVTKKNIENISSNFHVTYGQTTWMTLVAAILLWTGVILLCTTGFRGRRTRSVQFAVTAIQRVLT